MPLEDLDLEFEDEEELKKKSEALHSDVELEFTGIHERPAAVQAATPPQASAPQPQAVESKPVPKAQPQPTPEAAQEGTLPNVKRLEEVRAKLAQGKGTPRAAAPAAAAKPSASIPAVAGNTALQMEADPNLAQLVDLIETTKFEARVEVAVAQEMSVYMAEMLSDAKLLQHQIQQLLMRLNQKNPANKPELVAIQKALADFINKKRQFPHEK